MLLLGAGIVSYILWMVALYKDAKKIKSDWKTKEVKGVIKTGFSRGMKMLSLGFCYIVWVFGEMVFLNLSTAYKDFAPDFYGLAIVYFIILTVILFTSSVFARTEKPQSNILENSESERNVLPSAENEKKSKNAKSPFK
jgi:hypothetical protein